MIVSGAGRIETPSAISIHGESSGSCVIEREGEYSIVIDISCRERTRNNGTAFSGSSDGTRGDRGIVGAGERNGECAATRCAIFIGDGEWHANGLYAALF